MIKKKKQMNLSTVEEGMEADEVKAMFMSYPEDAEKVKATGQLDTDSQLYMDLFGNNVLSRLGLNAMVESSNGINDTNWHHIHVGYDKKVGETEVLLHQFQ